MVLAPIDPVAPSNVTLRSPLAACQPGFHRRLHRHQVTIPASRAQVHRYRRAPVRSAQASTAAATKPSSRSIRPPWPGIKAPASFAPNRRFIADSNRSPAWAAIDSAIAITTAGRTPPTPLSFTTSTEASTAPARPPIAPDQVLFGLRRGASFGSADGPADEVGGDIGHPHDGEQEDDGDEAELRVGAQDDRRQSRSHRHKARQQQPRVRARAAR